MRRNYSKQREEIRKAASVIGVHPTAEEIYGLVKEENSTASLSTVYRNLHELVKEGELKELILPNGVKRYDADDSEHNHAVCSCCGKIFDVDIVIEGLEQKIKELQGFQMNGYHVIVEGICQNCGKKEGARNVKKIIRN
jgi:Fe2+/Zn2+ uptake regulation proteins